MTGVARFRARGAARGAATAVTLAVAGLLAVGPFAGQVSAAVGHEPASAVQVASTTVGATKQSSARTAAATSTSFAVPADLKVMNYYPAADSWYAMWTGWDPTTFRSDMLRAHSLGANTIRLIIFPQYFGYPTPTAQMQARLSQAVSIAATAGLKTQLTLFDHFQAFTDLTGSATWTHDLLAPYEHDPRIAFVEVQNEVKFRQAAVLTWLKSEIGVINQTLPGTPVTASTSSAYGIGGPALLQRRLKGSGAEVSFADYHYYGPAQQAYKTFRAVKRSVAPSQLFLGEVGDSSVGPGYVSTTDGLESQALWLATVEKAATTAGLAPGAPWTLNDFTRAGQPYHDPNSQQYHFGLFRTDGTPKPAAYVVASAFGAGANFEKSLHSVQNRTVTANSTDTDFAALIPTQDRPANWTKHLPTAATFGLLRGRAPGGGNVVTLAHARGNNLGWPSLMTVPTEVVEAGQTWSMTADARGARCSGVNRIGIAWFGASGRFLGWTASAPVNCHRSGWQRLRASGHPLAGAVTAQVHVMAFHDTGKAEFANVSWTVSAG